MISLRHILCGASTTAAAISNVPLSEILKMADWLSPSTFQKFITNLFTAHILHMLFSSETFFNFVLTAH